MALAARISSWQRTRGTLYGRRRSRLTKDAADRPLASVARLLFCVSLGGGSGRHHNALNAIGKDGDAPRLNLERLARIVVLVRPFIADDAGVDEQAHALPIETRPILGFGMPPLDRRPESAAVFVFVANRHRVVEVDIQAQQSPRFGVALRKFKELRRRTNVAFANKAGAHFPDSWGLREASRSTRSR